MYCEYPCSQSSGCPDLATVCQSGDCTFNFCGTGTTNGAYDGKCNAAATNDGTCLPQEVDAGVYFGACVQGGTATTACSSTSTTRSAGASALCAPGGLCNGTSCISLCDPTAATNSCPTGESCSAAASDPALGICTGPADGGTGDGGTVTSDGGGGSCAADAGSEYASCSSNANCSCPLNCVTLPSGGASYCLTPCSSYTACQTFESCDSQLTPKSCLEDTCPNAGANKDGGTAYGPCVAGNDAPGSATGQCFPYPNGATGAYGVCFNAGSSTSACTSSPNPTWTSPPVASLCVPQDLCLSNGTTSSCIQGCDPTGTIGAPSCATGTTCNSLACDPSTDPNCNMANNPPCNAATDPNCDPYVGDCQ